MRTGLGMSMDLSLGVLPDGALYAHRVRQIFGSNLIQYLPGDEKSGTTALDYSGNARNGTYQGTPVFGASGIGDGRAAWNANAASDIAPHSASLASAWSGAEGFLSFWCKPLTAARWSDAGFYFSAYFGASGTYFYEVRFPGDGTVVFIERRSAPKFEVQRAPTTARWVHYTLTWSTIADKSVFYINGTRQIADEISSIGAWVGALAADTCYWGGYAGSLYLWPGYMAHMCLGNVCPTDAQADALAEPIGQIVFDGDSRTANKSWTSASAELAFSSGIHCYGRHGYATVGVSGDGSAQVIARGTATDALIKSGNNVYVLWVGVNDAAALTAQQIYDNIAARCTTARAAGWKVVVCTEIDAVSAGWTAKYQALNALLLAGYTAFADGIADLGANSELQDHTDTNYFNADGAHLIAAGEAVVRDTVYPVLASV